MKTMKKLMIITCVLLCCMLMSCPNNTKAIESGTRLSWDWDIGDDQNPGKFAPGISTLNGYTEHPTAYAQTYVLNSPYDGVDPTTGWYKIVTIDGIQWAQTEDAKGYDTSLYWPDNKGKGALIKKKVPTLVKTTGPDGTEVDAFHFWGTLMQKGSESTDEESWVSRTGTTTPVTATHPATDYRFGCGWPSINWAATPPNKTERLKLMDGYGYTFWFKSMKEYRTYRTAVENWDYRPLEGMDPSHWFGTTPGRDGTPDKNYTPVPVGVWTQVRVVYDPFHEDFNLDVPNWIYEFGIQNNFPGDMEPQDIMRNHDKDHSIKITFSLPLQHNGGNEGTAGIEYSVTTGRHDYDVYFYGLELLQY